MLIHAVVLLVGGKLPAVDEMVPAPRLEVAVRQPEVIPPAPIPPAAPPPVESRTAPPPPRPKPAPTQRSAPLPAREVPPAPAAASAPIAPVEDRAATASQSETPAGSAPATPAVPRPEAEAATAPPDYRAAYLNNPPPRYPLAARRQGEEGTVTLRVLVDRGGSPARVEIERSSGSARLDQAAVEAVKNWRFVPARRGAEPIDAPVLVPVIFKLDGGT